MGDFAASIGGGKVRAARRKQVAGQRTERAVLNRAYERHSLPNNVNCSYKKRAVLNRAFCVFPRSLPTV
jgi:hypothetical protein